MLCIILVAGRQTQLEKDLKETLNEEYQRLSGVPKALLPGLDGKKILDYWWNVLKMRNLFSDVFLVTNADKYKYFERWATANDFPVENIVNDGTTTNSNRLGSVSDFDLVLRNKKINEDVMVVAGDMLFEDQNFDISQVVRYFQHKEDGNLAIYYEMESCENQQTRGIVEVDSDSKRITKFVEKPSLSDNVTSRLASIVFYCFKMETLSTVSEYLLHHKRLEERTFGKYMDWLISEKEAIVYGMKLPSRFQLIGDVRLSDYTEWLNYFREKRESKILDKPFTSRAYARVGLVGNPSDGFYGKTISLSIENFWAEVSIKESRELVLQPHPLNDPTSFGSLQDLHGISRKEGYLGGLRLLQATCKKFYEYCAKKGVALHRRNFTISYDTNIPRQVGLAGSSAIVTSAVGCLIKFYNLSEHDMPKEVRASFILSVETDELFINAGLQDRVVQVYEGLVYMDFSKELMQSKNHGLYESIPTHNLPKFWLAYLSNPSDSGRIHNDVRKRYDLGETEVLEAMEKFAQYTENAKIAILEENWKELANIMNKNFDLRRKIYGEKCIGEKMLRMVEKARQFKTSAKFPGSGGAVVGLCHDDDQLIELRKAMQSEGYVFINIMPRIP